MSCRPIRILAASAAAFLSVSAVHSQQPRISERRDFSASGRETLKLAKDATLEIKAVNADITVVKAQGEDATLNIERSAAAAEPRVEILTHDGGVTLCTMYTSPHPKKPNECVPGSKGRLTEGVRKDSPGVRFQIELPEGVHVRADVVSGNLTANAGGSNLNLKTSITRSSPTAPSTRPTSSNSR